MITLLRKCTSDVHLDTTLRNTYRNKKNRKLYGYINGKFMNMLNINYTNLPNQPNMEQMVLVNI